ncbi:MAG: 4-(cytidine 5'-diphospho)-2-C-methyl-D-erythritol kinase [Sulfitobacter sp.]
MRSPSLKASEAFAPAKINLTLHITGQRADGYHLLDSIAVFADIGDLLTFAPSSQTDITVTGAFAAGVPTDHRNLVWQAATLARQTARITLEKNLPHGAGIGGGSSDAAAVLRHFDMPQGALELGADVPVCLTPQAQRMRGIGDQLEVLPALPPLFAVLVNPQIHVPTPDVFRALAHKENAPMPAVLPAWNTTGACIEWLATMRNDLEPPAIATAPQIAEVLTAINSCKGAALARMSGSGATCFGLFEAHAEAAAAADALAQDYPQWWVRACRLS